MKKLMIAAMALALAACTDPEGAKRALIGMGMNSIEITGWVWAGCSDNDTFATGFRAVGPSGTPVQGVVCSGWLKGQTVRFY